MELLQVTPDQLLLFVRQLLPSFPYIVLNQSRLVRSARFAEKTRGKPERLEAEAYILAQILVTNTDEKICEEGVKVAAGVIPNQYLQDVLERYNASRILVRQFTIIVKVVPSLCIFIMVYRQEYDFLTLNIKAQSKQGVKARSASRPEKQSNQQNNKLKR